MKKYRDVALSKKKDHRKRDELNRLFRREAKFPGYYYLATKTASHVRQTPLSTDWTEDLVHQDTSTPVLLFLNNNLVHWK